MVPHAKQSSPLPNPVRVERGPLRNLVHGLVTVPSQSYRTFKVVASLSPPLQSVEAMGWSWFVASLARIPFLELILVIAANKGHTVLPSSSKLCEC